jgi:NADH:ubiquinone oxidoreductase subunit D
VRKIYHDQTEASARMNLIWQRNHKIRHAVEAIAPLPIPVNQQAIRVIREEVDRIEWALSDLLAR